MAVTDLSAYRAQRPAANAGDAAACTVVNFPGERTRFTEKDITAHVSHVVNCASPLGMLRMYEREAQYPGKGFPPHVHRALGLREPPVDPNAAAAFYARLQTRVLAMMGG